jgi:hypothetical protein
MVVSGEIALRRWPVVNLAHACLAVMAGTALGGGGAKRIPPVPDFGSQLGGCVMVTQPLQVIGEVAGRGQGLRVVVA